MCLSNASGSWARSATYSLRPQNSKAQCSSGKLIEGFREMNEWKEAEKMFQAARRARRKTHFVLAALVTHEIRHLLRPVEHCALEFWGRREYAADLAQDPEALLRHIRFVDRKSREHVERMLASDS